MCVLALVSLCVSLLSKLGLAILLWPLAVVGAVLGSIVSSIFLGAYAAVVVYQERSFWFGLCNIVTSLSIYDEYSNDVLNMPEGSCFPRLTYRKKTSRMSSSASFLRPGSFKNPPSRTGSVNGPMIELKPLELVNALFKECQLHGEVMALKGVITQKDIEDDMNNKASGGVISIGLPAYCILHALLRSANSTSAGILLSESVTEITTSNRPSDTFFEWFLNPAQFLYTNHSLLRRQSEAHDDVMIMEISMYLRQHARTIAGKSQLFINSYDKALGLHPSFSSTLYKASEIYFVCKFLYCRDECQFDVEFGGILPDCKSILVVLLGVAVCTVTEC
ncbi:hypothetical protein ACS0TY_031564 [Phlomoides rotata]